MNRTLINLIKKVTHQHPHTWDNMLPLFEFAYNQTPNSTTGIPPFLANQGYLPSTPAALLAASYTLTESSKPTAEFIQQIRKTFATVHTQIREAEEKEKAQIQRRENAKRGSPQFHVGDQVLMYWPPFQTYSKTPRKQRLRYEGPFTIIDVISLHCVRLDGLGSHMPPTINIEYLHHYHKTQHETLQRLRHTN